jgi:hypothetical protein
MGWKCNMTFFHGLAIHKWDLETRSFDILQHKL